MSPAIRVGSPRAPGLGAAVVAVAEEETAAAGAWRELRGRAAALAAAVEERAALARRIEAALEVRREALRQEEALDGQRRRVELRRARAEAAVVGRRRAAEGVERGKERLQEQIERVLPLSRALTAAHQRVQEVKGALSGDKARLDDLQRLLRTRQQCMVAKVASLYPVRAFHDLPRHAENPGTDTNGEHGALSEETRALSGTNGTHAPSIMISPQLRAFTFFGWQIMKPKRKQKNYSDKDLQRSSAVLGYAAQAVLLIASYLDVPLRYPLRFGGSRSYVSDHLPSAETAPYASAGHPSLKSTESELSEYPLFLECQEDDHTAASYAIYLLHKATERGQAMGDEAKQGAFCIINKTIRSSIKTSWRCVSEHRALFSLVLLLYLFYKFSPGFFSFLLSASPVIICTTLLLGVLLSCGSAQLPEIHDDRNAPDNISAPEFENPSRNVHIKAQQKRFPVPTLGENIITESSFGRRDCNKHAYLGENVPLLKQVHQGDERLEKILISVPSLRQDVAVEQYMKANAEKESKDAFLSKDRGDDHANLFDDVHHSKVDGEGTNQGRVSTDEQSGEVAGVSEHNKAADGAAGKCKWGRAFSVRQRKKLADIKIEAINSVVGNQSDHPLSSSFARVGSHENSPGFDPDNAEGHSPDLSMTNTAPALDETETGPLGADFSCPDRIANDDSGNHSNISSLDPPPESDSNEVAVSSKAKDDGEKKDAGSEPAFLWTADDEKNTMDLGYSEMERNRRLEILMVKRKSRKNIIFDADELSRFRPQVQPISVSARRMNPFADDSEMPGSAPSVLHPRKNPFDFLTEQSNDGALPAPHNLEPQELMPAPHQDALFKRHESFSMGRPPQRHGSRFKPCFVLEELSFDEASAGSFQRQFSDRSVSRLSAVSECDTASSVGDQEHNDLIRSYIRGVRESPSLLGQQDGGDAVRPGNECSDGIGFVDNETLNAAIC